MKPKETTGADGSAATPFTPLERDESNPYEVRDTAPADDFGAIPAPSPEAPTGDRSKKFPVR